VKRLVMRAPNWLGDVILALPAMAAVRARFADAHLAVAAIPSIAPLFEEETSAAPDSVVTLADRAAEIAALREGRFDAILLFPNSFRSALIARRAGISERWGYSAGLRRVLLTRAVARPRGRRHQSDFYRELVKGLGIPPTVSEPSIVSRPATLARADALLASHGVGAPAESGFSRTIGFAPGAAYGHAKRWPPRMVAETIVRLSREVGARCVLFGAAGDRESGREIESSLPSDVRIVNLIGRTDLRLLVGAISRCAAFVSNDSGAMHLAAALGVPVAAMFGPTDERATSPLGGRGRDGAVVTPDVLTHAVFCRPCMLRDCPIDHRCMKGIAVDAVVTAVTRRLSRERAIPAGHREEVVT
jgi:lipopolysaccharide heptosyltransferase II